MLSSPNLRFLSSSQIRRLLSSSPIRCCSHLLSMTRLLSPDLAPLEAVQGRRVEAARRPASGSLCLIGGGVNHGGGGHVGWTRSSRCRRPPLPCPRPRMQRRRGAHPRARQELIPNHGRPTMVAVFSALSHATRIFRRRDLHCQQGVNDVSLLQMADVVVGICVQEGCPLIWPVQKCSNEIFLQLCEKELLTGCTDMNWNQISWLLFR